MVLGKLFTSLLVPKPAVAPGNQALIIDILFLELNHLISISNVQEKILIYNTNSFHPPSPTSLPPPQPGCSTCQFDKEKQEKALPSQVPQPTQLGNLTRLYLTIVPSASIGPGYTCTSLKWPTWWTKSHTDFHNMKFPQGPKTTTNWSLTKDPTILKVTSKSFHPLAAITNLLRSLLITSLVTWTALEQNIIFV